MKLRDRKTFHRFIDTIYFSTREKYTSPTGEVETLSTIRKFKKNGRRQKLKKLLNQYRLIYPHNRPSQLKSSITYMVYRLHVGLYISISYLFSLYREASEDSKLIESVCRIYQARNLRIPTRDFETDWPSPPPHPL